MMKVWNPNFTSLLLYQFYKSWSLIFLKKMFYPPPPNIPSAIVLTISYSEQLSDLLLQKWATCTRYPKLLSHNLSPFNIHLWLWYSYDILMFVHQKVYANFRNYGLFDFSGEDLKDTYPYFHFFSYVFLHAWKGRTCQFQINGQRILYIYIKKLSF